MKCITKILLFIISLFIFNKVYALDFEINSDKAILINTTDNMTLYEKNSNEKASIASLTKIITTITAIDNSNNLDEEVTINWEMLSGLDGYSKAGLQYGDTVTVKDLLYLLMLPSGADAAQALAYHISGSIDSFIELMNKEVEKIGCINSHFDNPIGMDSENNYSTASDLALILQYSLKNEVFKQIFEANEYYVSSIDKTIYKTLYNTSELYNIDTSIIKGAKTGWTNNAGMCLATTSTIDDTDYILIVLNAEELSLKHIEDTINIYNYYKENYSHTKILEKNQVLYTLKVKDSKQKEYNITSDKDVVLYLNNDINKDTITIEYKGIKEIKRKTKKGTLLGKVNIKYKDETIYSFDAYLNEDIKYYNYELYISIGVSILLIITILLIIKLKKKH